MRTRDVITAENLEGFTADWLSAIRAEVRPRPGLHLNPADAALLVVDMNGYFASPEGRCWLPAVAAITTNIQKLQRLFRHAGRPVIFTRHGHHGPDDTGMLGRFFNDYIRADSDSARLIDAVAPAPGETIIDKKTYDAFLNTDLEAHLRGIGVTQLVISGVLTQMCVETTARSAFCRGFEVYVPADATATSAPEIHLRSLAGMATAVAVILSTTEIEDAWHPKT